MRARTVSTARMREKTSELRRTLEPADPLRATLGAERDRSAYRTVAAGIRGKAVEELTAEDLARLKAARQRNKPAHVSPVQARQRRLHQAAAKREAVVSRYQVLAEALRPRPPAAVGGAAADGDGDVLFTPQGGRAAAGHRSASEVAAAIASRTVGPGEALSELSKSVVLDKRKETRAAKVTELLESLDVRCRQLHEHNDALRDGLRGGMDAFLAREEALKAQIAERQKVLRELGGAMGAGRDAAGKDGEAFGNREHLVRLRSTAADLQSRIKSMQAELERESGHVALAEDFADQLDDTKARLGAATVERSEFTAALSTKVQELSTAKVEQRDALHRVQDEVQELRATCEDLESTMESGKRDLAVLSQQLYDLKKDNERMVKLPQTRGFVTLGRPESASEPRRIQAIRLPDRYPLDTGDHMSEELARLSRVLQGEGAHLRAVNDNIDFEMDARPPLFVKVLGYITEALGERHVKELTLPEREAILEKIVLDDHVQRAMFA